jgi:thiol-disulfide isomerase/thioredoxin
MKNKIIKFFLYLCNGFTIQYLISFGRLEKVDYLKLPLICLVFFFAGYVIRHFEKKITFNVIFFLLIASGLPLLSAFQVKGHIINWIIEFSIATPSFLAGFYLEILKPVKKLIAIVFLFLFTIVISFFLNPQIMYSKNIDLHSKKELYGKSLFYNFSNEKGYRFTSEMFKGKVVLLDYWFIGCSPCYLKMKELNKLAEHYRDNKDVVILTVDAGDIDTYEKFQKEISRFSNTILHTYDSAALVAKKLKIAGFPTEFIIDKKGLIRDQFVGYSKDISLVYLNKTIHKIDALLHEK